METDEILKIKYDDYAYNERMLLMYTDKCTANCSHCAAESSPNHNSKMSVGEAKRYIKIAASKGFKCILWTGGEIFIYYDEILELTEYGSSLGLVFTIDTNAYWATSKEIAYEKLQRLQKAGVIHIGVSCDAFHLKYIPIDRVANAIKASQDLNLSTIVSFTYSGNKKEDNKILSTLKDYEVPFEVSEVAKVGFAKNLPDEVFGRIDISEIGSCGELGPLVRPDGSIIGCCNPTVPKQSPVFIGAGKENFEDNLNKYLKSDCINSINELGFKTFFELLSSDLVFSKYKTKKYSHCCEFCEDIFSDGYLSGKICDFIQKDKE